MLSIKEQEEELLRVVSDPFIFLKYVKIQEPGELALDYELWPHLVEFYKSLALYKRLDVLKSKQIGISWALAIDNLRQIYTMPGANILEISGGEVEAKALLAKSRTVYFNLPDWMRIFTPNPDSSETFGFKELGSKIRALPSTETASIGETASRVVSDENDFHPYAEINYGHAKATIEAGGQDIRVSTVDKTKPDSFFKNHFRAAWEGRNGYKAFFFPYDVRPGRDEAWLERVRAENESTPWLVEQNYPRSVEEALSSQSAQSCFMNLDSLWKHASEPEIRQGFIYILCLPKVGTQYAAGVDVGEGVGLDYSVLTILGRYGLQSEVCALIYTNTVATDLFAYEVNKLCCEYDTPLLAIENNALGVAVCNKVVELGYPNLFYSNKKVGWTTGEKNKQLALAELVPDINNGSLITRFKPQIKELMEYQWVNGKPVATGKTHGDTVISLMLANQMLKRTGRKQKASGYVGGYRIF